MPSVVPLAVAGVSGLLSLFGGKRKKVKDPEFFGPELDRIEQLLSDRTSAAGAGAIDRTREELANLGLLQSGNLPDAITRVSAGLESQRLGSVADLYREELGRFRDFQANKYFAEQGLENQEYLQGKQSRSRALEGIGGAVGQYYSEKEADKRYNRLLDYFESTERRNTSGINPPGFEYRF